MLPNSFTEASINMMPKQIKTLREKKFSECIIKIILKFYIKILTDIKL